jgi:hypothetical protein
VKLTGGQRRTGRFRYVLDGSVRRTGTASLTFHDVAAGRHHLLVSLVSDGGVRATDVWVVHAPPLPSTPATPVPTATPATTPAAAPAPATTPAPAPAPAVAPMPASGIPQNNGGDADGDNNGAPSDGDGNI